MKGDAEKFACRVDGWLLKKEGELLYDLAKKCSGRGAIVEVGSWKGKSTIWLAFGSKDGAKARVYAIDPHTGSQEHRDLYGKLDTFGEFSKNISCAGVSEIVKPLVKTSEEAARSFSEPVELVFIDGAHEYDMVEKDFQLWFPRLVEGGVMAFHDTIGWEGPIRVARDRICRSRQFKNAGFVGSILFAEKTSQNTFLDRIRSRFVLFQNVFRVWVSRLPEGAKSPVRKILKPS